MNLLRFRKVVVPLARILLNSLHWNWLHFPRNLVVFGAAWSGHWQVWLIWEWSRCQTLESINLVRINVQGTSSFLNVIIHFSLTSKKVKKKKKDSWNLIFSICLLIQHLIISFSLYYRVLGMLEKKCFGILLKFWQKSMRSCQFCFGSWR